LLAQGDEWAAIGHHSDEEEAENGCRSTRHAQQTFHARERRLTLGADALERHAMIGDVDVEVHAEGKEWQHGSDSGDDAAHDEQSKLRHAENTFRKRERRLTHGEQELLSGRPHGDKDVDLLPEKSEWAHHEGDSSDGEGAQAQFSEEVHRRRERRLTRGASIRDMEVTMGDIDVPVVAEKTEWAGCGDRGDSEEEGEDAQRRHADDTSRSRERRLTFGMEALKDEKPLGDLEVPILAHSAEWGALEGNHEEDEDDHERSHTERSMARERRLTEGEEALKRFASAGDADEKEQPDC